MSKTEAILWSSATDMDKDACIEDQENGNKMIHTVKTPLLTSAYRYTKVGCHIFPSRPSGEHVLGSPAYVLSD